MKSHEIPRNPTSCFFPVTTWRRPRRVAPRLQRCDQCLWEDRRMAAGWASREVLKVGIFSYGMMYDYIYIHMFIYIYIYMYVRWNIHIYIIYIHRWLFHIYIHIYVYTMDIAWLRHQTKVCIIWYWKIIPSWLTPCLMEIDLNSTLQFTVSEPLHLPTFPVVFLQSCCFYVAGG